MAQIAKDALSKPEARGSTQMNILFLWQKSFRINDKM